MIMIMGHFCVFAINTRLFIDRLIEYEKRLIVCSFRVKINSSMIVLVSYQQKLENKSLIMKNGIDNF